MKRLPALLLAFFAIIQFTHQDPTTWPPPKSPTVFDTIKVEVKNGKPLEIGRGWWVHSIAFEGLKKNQLITCTVDNRGFRQFYGIGFELILNATSERITIAWKKAKV